MNYEKEKTLEKEILCEEYTLGKDYYNKILDKAKEESKENYE